MFQKYLELFQSAQMRNYLCLLVKQPDATVITISDPRMPFIQSV